MKLQEVQECLHESVSKTNKLETRTNALEITVDEIRRTAQCYSREIHKLKEDLHGGVDKQVKLVEIKYITLVEKEKLIYPCRH